VTARRLVLLRHGQTSWNEAGRAQGHADISLDATGHAQAAAVAPYLAAVRPVALWSSDLARARETCGYVAEAAGLSVKHDERLREFDVGARQGLTLDEFAVRFPDEHAQWVAGDEPMPVAGGETADDVCARMVPVLRECLDSLDAGETGVVVGHGAALKVGLLGLLGWDIDGYRELVVLDNCGWATVERRAGDDRVRLAGYNEKVLRSAAI